MNLKKQEFKKAYSDFRKELNHAYNYLGKDAYILVHMNNKLFSNIKCKTEFPVSFKIWKHNLLKSQSSSQQF